MRPEIIDEQMETIPVQANDIENELTSSAGRKVDLRTPGDLSRYFRDDVIRQAEEQYVIGR